MGPKGRKALRHSLRRQNMLTHSTKLHAPEQDWLLHVPPDRRFKTVAEKRTFFGKACECVVASLVGAGRLVIDGRRDVCLDLLHVPSSTYIESKSCGESGRFIVYEWRKKKEHRFIQQRHAISYAVVRHHVRSDAFNTWRELIQCLASHPLECTIADYDEMTSCLEGEPKKFNHISERNMKHGSVRGEYSAGGWRVSYAKFRNLALPTYPVQSRGMLGAHRLQIEGQEILCQLRLTPIIQQRLQIL
jgi:hypothetical protein